MELPSGCIWPSVQVDPWLAELLFDYAGGFFYFQINFFPQNRKLFTLSALMPFHVVAELRGKCMVTNDRELRQNMKWL